MGALHHVALLSPHTLMELSAINLETGRPIACPPPDSFWHGVLGQLRLEPQQVEGVRAIRDIYQGLMDR